MAPPPGPPPGGQQVQQAPSQSTPMARWTLMAGIGLFLIAITIWMRISLLNSQSLVVKVMSIIFGVAGTALGALYSFIQLHQHFFPHSLAGMSNPTLLTRLYSNTKLVRVIDYGILVVAIIGIFVALIFPYPSNTWTMVAEGSGPMCDGVKNSVWQVSDGLQSATNIRCLSNELEIAPSSSARLAEIDLEQVNGGSYSQTRFDVLIQVTFEAAQADANTLAGLVVQTPQHGKGGYILAMDNTGHWELVDNNANRKASYGLTTTADSFTIRVKVEQGYLSCWINDQQVLDKYKDTLNASSSVLGLVVYGYKPPLSAVTFSNFSLSV